MVGFFVCLLSFFFFTPLVVVSMYSLCAFIVARSHVRDGVFSPPYNKVVFSVYGSGFLVIS